MEPAAFHFCTRKVCVKAAAGVELDNRSECDSFFLSLCLPTVIPSVLRNVAIARWYAYIYKPGLGYRREALATWTHWHGGMQPWLLWALGGPTGKYFSPISASLCWLHSPLHSACVCRQTKRIGILVTPNNAPQRAARKDSLGTL